jgi:fatty acid desaturase
MIVKIYNKYYDISNFIKIHPGGEKILESCEAIDATNAFESYHAFSDMNKIEKIMKKYECNNPPYYIESTDSTFNKSGFYDSVKKKVKKYFNKKSTKWTYSWLGTFVTTSSIYTASFMYTFLGTNQPFIYRIASSIISGASLMCWLLQGYHDATHSAISKHKVINKSIAWLGSGLAFWDWSIWMKHHSILHHSFTGNYKLDPDMRHTHPFFKKSIKSKANKINSLTMITIILLFIPGLYCGQILSYSIGGFNKILWGFKINKAKTISEWIIICIQLMIMYYGKSIILVILYFLSLNISYSISILPDHDQLETNLNSKVKTKDWGEMQVRHSGNFALNNLYYTRLYGSINYQIEHHLFPSLCSWHLPAISKIVKETCIEHDIKYISNPSIIDSYKSAIHNLYLINNKESKIY